jgi:hypothetical protein
MSITEKISQPRKAGFFDQHAMAAWWDYEKNGDIKPSMVARFAKGKFAFYHAACGHNFMYVLGEVKTDNPVCPYCNSRPILCGQLECTFCIKRSLASFDLQELVWLEHENFPVTPICVPMWSTKKNWFIHPQCGHTFQLKPAVLTHPKKASLCPFCCYNKPRLCGDMKCKHCYDRSLASVTFKGLVWDNIKNNVSMHMLLPGSHLKCHFTCTKCGHGTLIIIKDAADSIGCQYCVRSVHCGDRNCQLCKNNSIMSLKMSKYLSPKNDAETWKLSKGNSKVVIFDCPYCGNEYRAVVLTVFHGHWCNCRKNKSELKLYNFLTKSFPNKTIEREVRFDWCVNEDTDYRLPFDFCVDGCIIIELDGNQHFIDMPIWKSNAMERQERDTHKIICALENGFRVIRLYQKDVFRDKNNWASQLKALIDDDSNQLAFVTTDNNLVTSTYAMYAKEWEDYLTEEFE